MTRLIYNRQCIKKITSFTNEFPRSVLLAQASNLEAVFFSHSPQMNDQKKKKNEIKKEKKKNHKWSERRKDQRLCSRLEREQVLAAPPRSVSAGD